MTGVITNIVTQMSGALNVLLLNSQQRPLQDEKILLGREHIADGSAAPRVVMVPLTTRYTTARHSPSTETAIDANGRAMRLRARPLWSEALTFEVHCWGDTESFSTADPSLAFDVTQTLAHTVMTAAYLVMTANGCRPTSGSWGDQVSEKADLLISGHYMIFGLEVDIPVTAPAEHFVPPGTHISLPDAAKNPSFTGPAGD